MCIRGGAIVHIAICDDEKTDVDVLVHALKEYGVPGMKLSTFLDSKSLLECAQKNQYDLVILDIQMPPPDGYEAAVRLREMNPKTLIIFFTNSMDYSLAGYGVAFRYLSKPIEKKTLFHALDAAVCEIMANRFVFSADGESHVLSMDEIYYVEVFNHHTVLHTVDCEYTFRSTLKEVLSQLPAGYYGSPHQSYVVNFSHIKTATAQELHLTNGVTIPISRRRQREFTEQFYAYLGR
nr:LytTR family DNA-binding domain-containing protein [Pseudoflavonifractor capillosus]